VKHSFFFKAEVEQSLKALGVFVIHFSDHYYWLQS